MYLVDTGKSKLVLQGQMVLVVFPPPVEHAAVLAFVVG